MPVAVTSPLDTMKSIMGTKWFPDEGPNKIIGSWLNFIADEYPSMAAYCNSVLHMDYFQWCGLTVAYCMAKANIEPVFGATDVTRFLWAEAWLNWGQAVSTPALGDVLVFNFGGGDQHVTLFNGDAGGGLWTCLGGNQSHEVKVSNYPKSAVIGIRRPSGATAALVATAAVSTRAQIATTAGADDPSVPNAYKDLPVVPYAKTTMSTTAIAGELLSQNIDVNIKRAAYVLICNESASGQAGINNNYGGLQADVGRWSHDYDQYISATCVVTDNSGAKRRFLCFSIPQGCFDMITNLVQKRGIYVGGTTSFITQMQVTSPTDWALAYYREWVTGDANANISPPALHSLLSLYQNALDVLP
jgi:uncharacterized protein (TIGR02594 family)